MITLTVLVATGALVGFCIGLTGVGGGSLMTPILLMMGIPAPVAIGTDLLYASITKAGSALVHIRQRHVNKPILIALSLGSLPASLLTSHVLTLSSWHASSRLMTLTLAFMLSLTGISLLFKRRVLHTLPLQTSVPEDRIRRKDLILTCLTGAVLGVLVTLSSVGAGAIGVVVLLALHPRLRMINVIGTDVTHAVLLTLVAGLGHWQAHHVDTRLLLSLSIAALPAMFLGIHLSSRTPDHWLRIMLGFMLIMVSGKFAFF
ncbi:MAG: sulfite exporter TauE/SafE family protein [Pseudomonadales bacterium]|nr:sulfite exporter TauE/SafE family protein [Pseudomonadales bacterium]